MQGYGFENDEHRELREQARRFASAEIAPHAHAWEEAEGFPRELYKRFAESGLLGLGYAESLGGSGGDAGHAWVVSEELVLAARRSGAVMVAAINYREGLAEVCDELGLPLICWEIDPKLGRLAPCQRPVKDAHISRSVAPKTETADTRK